MAGQKIEVIVPVKCDFCMQAFDSARKYNEHLGGEMGCIAQQKRAQMEELDRPEHFPGEDRPGTKYDLGTPTARKKPWTMRELQKDPPEGFGMVEWRHSNPERSYQQAIFGGVKCLTPANTDLRTPAIFKYIIEQAIEANVQNIITVNGKSFVILDNGMRLEVAPEGWMPAAHQRVEE